MHACVTVYCIRKGPPLYSSPCSTTLPLGRVVMNSVEPARTCVPPSVRSRVWECSTDGDSISERACRPRGGVLPSGSAPRACRRLLSLSPQDLRMRIMRVGIY
eukprot:1160929-Pelagomonas_calceolata.AAC.3